MFNYDNYPFYGGEDLGPLYTNMSTKFRLYAPTAEKVTLCIFNSELIKYDMEKDQNGTWYIEVKGDLHNISYTYRLLRNGKHTETPDPYSKALTANGLKSVVVDLSKTNPENWETDVRPPMKNYTDSIIYEIHIRDFSSSPVSGIKNKAKYLAFTEKNTVGPEGVKTGLDHLNELGITHVQILPIQDFASVDEITGGYNWGYDPYHYFVPEGSYSSNSQDPVARIKEVKQMIKSLHDNGIRIVMDVVYNHTYSIHNSIFDMVEPGYYYRHNHDGSYSNGSGVGNETASERPMMQKLILDSLKYWVEEYHVDGFRFDLMALHDIDTMRKIENMLHNIDKTLLIYGEPWSGGPSALAYNKQFLKGSQKNMSIAVFNDNFRNGIKGYPDDDSIGFATGRSGISGVIKNGVVGSIIYNDSIRDFTQKPSETINYVSCHDNLTLWDKIAKSNHDSSKETRIAMDKLSNMIILTSQGIPFIQGGEEFLRTKHGNNNSYNAGDEINHLDWSRKFTYKDVFDYYKGLIALRKAHPAFRMTEENDIRTNLIFLDSPKGTVAFLLKNNANNDPWETIAVIYNSTIAFETIHLPDANWEVVVDDQKSGTEKIVNGKWKLENNVLTIPPICGMVLHS